MKKKMFFILSLTLWLVASTKAQPVVSEKQPANSFSTKNAVIYVDANDFPLVKKSAELLQQDVETAPEKKTPLLNTIANQSEQAIVIGSQHRSSLRKMKIRRWNLEQMGW